MSHYIFLYHFFQFEKLKFISVFNLNILLCFQAVFHVISVLVWVVKKNNEISEALAQSHMSKLPDGKLSIINRSVYFMKILQPFLVIESIL